MHLLPEIVVYPDFDGDGEVGVADPCSSLVHHVSHQFWVLNQTGSIPFCHSPPEKKNKYPVSKFTSY
jgi:hypothetical protein